MKHKMQYSAWLIILLMTKILVANEVRLYSERHYDADKELFTQFTQQTGIAVKVLKASADELIARIQSERSNPQADLYLTKDAAALDRATKLNLLAPLKSKFVAEHVPESLRGKQNTWTALTMRGRVIVYAKDRIKDTDLPHNYLDLANKKYRGKLLIRSSNSKYNRSLLASILHNHGINEAMKWVKGVKDNLARPPQGGDRDQIRALAKGLGDYAVTNTYYLGIMEQSDNEKDRKARASVKVLFPDSDQNGTHVNISGAGIVKGAQNEKHARTLIEFLLTEEIQKTYQEKTSEYSVLPSVKPTNLQAKWGTLVPDTKSLHELDQHYKQAIKLFDLVGWQ